MSRSKFSVVTCCYNQGQFLDDVIRSVQTQHYANFEHIIVDDGSTDNTRDVCARYPHVKYIHQKNAGQSAALNRGFQAATGDIIAWVNSDDYFEPGAFHRVARELDPGRGRWIVAGAAKVVDAGGHYLWLLKNGHVSFFRLLFHPRLYPLNGWTVMPCQPSVFFHKRVYDDLGPLDTRLKYGMDYDYWLRAMMKGYGFHYVPQIFSAYRYHATSHSNQGFDTFLAEWQEISNRYFRLLPAGRRALAESWWAYARVESVLVKHHKAALGWIAGQMRDHPELQNPRGRFGLMLRASLRAPWLVVMFAWHKIFGNPEQRLLALAEKCRAEAE